MAILLLVIVIAIIVLVALVVLLMFSFLGSAAALLPYTVISAVLAMLTVFGVVRATMGNPRCNRFAKPTTVFLCVLLMTVAFGYVGTAMVPPNLQELESLPSMNFVLGVDTDLSQLTFWLPIHLVIAGLISGSIASGTMLASLAARKKTLT